ncbi:MAG: hypothetical protein ACP5NW_05690, partial [Candidatus Woesearchaeota archaeon]
GPQRDSSTSFRTQSYAYGVHYLAIAGAGITMNPSDWCDYYDIGITVSGDYVSSPKLLGTADEIRSAFAANNKLYMFDSQAVMCNLVGDHIFSHGASGKSGVIKCCGQQGDSDKGIVNQEYVCQKVGEEYTWNSVCSSTWNSAYGTPVGTTVSAIQSLYCSECNTPSTGICKGSIDLTCKGTYTCYGKNIEQCSMLPGCEWMNEYGVPTEIAALPYNLDMITDGAEYFDAVPLASNIERFAYEIEPTLTPYCADNYEIENSCGALSDETCNSIQSECYLLDSEGGSGVWNLTDCGQYTSYGVDFCNARDYCSWGCRKEAGEICSVNSDCQSPLQCDPDLLGNKRCHATDNMCVLDATGTEVAINSYICSHGQYTQCQKTNTPYSTNYCLSYSSGYECTGTIKSPPVCYGNVYCGQFTNTSSCIQYNDFDKEYCSWKDIGYCNGSFELSPCGMGVKGLEANIFQDGEYQENFDATPYANDIISNFADCTTEPTTVYCYEEYTNKSDCMDSPYPECNWVEHYSCVGEGANCSAVFTTSNCNMQGCNVLPSFSSCTGRPYKCSTDPLNSNFLTGCNDTCISPRFGAPIDVEAITSSTPENIAACACAGKDIKVCYPDYDGDGKPNITSSITRCVFDAPNYRYTDPNTNKEYICGTVDVGNESGFDCDDTNTECCVLYYERTQFAEYQELNFSVPLNGTIKNVFVEGAVISVDPDNPTGVSIGTYAATMMWLGNSKPICNDPQSPVQFCSERKYSNVSSISRSNSGSIDCVSWNPMTSQWVSSKSTTLDSIICSKPITPGSVAIPTFSSFSCGTVDGVCPDDFNATCGVTTGLPTYYYNPSVTYPTGPICSDNYSVSAYCAENGLAGGKLISSISGGTCVYWNTTENMWQQRYVNASLATNISCVSQSYHVDPDCGEHRWMQCAENNTFYNPNIMTAPLYLNKSCDNDVLAHVEMLSTDSSSCVYINSSVEKQRIPSGADITIGSINLTCSNGVWCRAGFAYDSDLKLCLYGAASCDFKPSGYTDSIVGCSAFWEGSSIINYNTLSTMTTCVTTNPLTSKITHVCSPDVTDAGNTIYELRQISIK